MSNTTTKTLQQFQLLVTELMELAVASDIKLILQELLEANETLLQTPINFTKPEYINNIFGSQHSSLANLLQVQFDSLAHHLRCVHNSSSDTVKYWSEVKQLLQHFANLYSCINRSQIKSFNASLLEANAFMTSPELVSSAATFRP